MNAMNHEEASNVIAAALAKATGKRNIELEPDTHLVESGILDSLDASVFLLEVEKMTGKKITDQEVEDEMLFRVDNLTRWLCK